MEVVCQVRRKDEEGLILTARDLEILEFLNDMGPMSVEPLALRFWKKGSQEGRLRGTRRRLSRLRDKNLIDVILFNDPKYFYRTTALGVSALKNLRPNRIQISATNQSSFNITHSLLVAHVRVKLEQIGIVSSWRSERRILLEDLPILKKRLQGKMKPYIPDGVYEGKGQSGILFELEHYPKSPHQRKSRISNIKGLLSYLPDHYKSIHIVSTNQTVADSYKDLTKGLKVQVQEIGELFSKDELAHVLNR